MHLSGTDAEPPGPRAGDFTVLRQVPTRWADQDAYGHVNNAVHYEIFDSAVNGWLIETIGDGRARPAIGVVAETSCRYLRELHFPEMVSVGLALERIGRRSVTYGLALFGDRGPSPVAVGRFVHVYVDRETRRTVDVPDAVRRAATMLGTPPADLDRRGQRQA